MSEELSLDYKLMLARQTLYEIKDCPLSKEEMIEKAFKTLKEID